MNDVTVLDRELYDVSVAAAVLRVPPSTLRWWLEGGERRGRVYAPVLRVEPTGSSTVTWGEVVEAGYLTGYRKGLGVKLSHLRDFISDLRYALGVPYPLATARPWVGVGRKLLVQAASALSPDLAPALVEPRSGQTVLLPIAERFLARVEFEPKGPEGIATRIWPLGKSSPVVIDPNLRFGAPSVRGISTEVLVERLRAEEPIEGIAAAFDIDPLDVLAAINFERSDWPRLLSAA